MAFDLAEIIIKVVLSCELRHRIRSLCLFCHFVLFFGPVVQHRQLEERLCREATLLTVNHGGKLSAGVAAVFIMA